MASPVMNKTEEQLTFSRRGVLKTALLGGSASWLAGLGHAAAEEQPAAKVRGVIFMVSDGMSPGALTLAEAFSQLTRQRGTRWWQLFNRPDAARGLMDTASASSMVTDSAAASSAWGGGKRIHNGVINIAPDGRELTPIAAVLKRKPGTRVGLVTTATVTHATPAGFAAVVPSRASEALIAPQYLDRVDVILGGGTQFFDAKTRPDKRDLRADFITAGYQSVTTREELLAAKSSRLLGTFASGHLPFEIDRLNQPALAKRVPSLSEMALAALHRLLQGDAPFLLQVEGARVDHAAHLNDIAGLLADQLAFDDAVGAVLDAVAGRQDILVVVTSDHGNANPGLNGIGGNYSRSTRSFGRIVRAKMSHEALFAAWSRENDRTPDRLSGLVEAGLGVKLTNDECEALTTVLAKGQVTEWNHLLDNPEGLLGQFCGNHTGIGWTGTTHTSDPTLVSAVGPQADRFGGMLVNAEVFGHLVDLLA